MSSLAAASALWRRADLQRIALAVLLLVAAFAVIYLVAANVILRTRFLRDRVSEGQNVELGYASAYSVWPGLVHVRGLELSVQDYKVQFSVRADSGVVMVSLPDLLFRRFHATRVSLEGLAFRLRQKVAPEDAQSARVRAFPAIDGFDDPPVYSGPEPPPIPDAEYDLWEIALDDVEADLQELWLYEYRYLGTGRIARGGFRLRPARSYAVYPARVQLTRGTVSVGDEVAVQRLTLDVQAHVEPTDVRTTRAAARAEAISGRLHIEARGLDFAALDVGAAERGPRRLAGDADLTLALAVQAGRLEPGASAELDARRVALTSALGELSGSLSSTARSLPGGQIEWIMSSPKLSMANGSRRPGPVLGSPRLTLMLQSETIGKPPELSELRFEAPQLAVPSLNWMKPWLVGAGVPVRLGGRLDGRAQLSWTRGRGPFARVQLRLADAKLSSEKFHASLSGEIAAKLEPVGGDSASAGRLDIVLEGGLKEGRDRADSILPPPSGRDARRAKKPFRAAIHLPDLKVDVEGRAVSANVEVSAKPADPLLSLALGSPLLKDLAVDVFDLEALDAEARLNVSRRTVRLDLARAVSGGLEGAGYWQRPAAGDPRGAFLISSKVANVGISLSGSDTSTAWFVPDDWLSTNLTR